jgi:ATP-dependent DNA helicase RecQ
LKLKHEKLPSYGTGSTYSKEYWQHLAVQFVRMGLLNRTRPHGSLKVTAAGRAVLQGQEVWGTLPGRFVRTAAPEMPEHAPELYEQLRALRARLAKERNIPPYVIFHDRSIIEMAARFPRTPAQLGQIYGVGQRKMEAYGPHFLPVIQIYCEENDAPPFQKSTAASSRPVSSSGKKRTDYVWEHFQAGESIPSIAEDLGFKQMTILNHLKKAFEAGRPLRIADLKETSKLTAAEEQRVIAAFDDCGTTYLKPTFEALNETVPYDQLHLWRLIYQVMGAME